jgi:hypothetical protein
MQIIYSDYLKGLELPVNTMIVVVVCLIVLLAIVALFYGTWNSGKGALSQEAAKNSACQALVAMSCNADPSSISVRDFDADRDGNLNTVGNLKGACNSAQGDTLYMLCKCWYGISEVLYPTPEQFNDQCKSVCMCQRGAGTGTSGGSVGPGGGGIPCPNGDSDCPPFTTCSGGAVPVCR